MATINTMAKVNNATPLYSPISQALLHFLIGPYLCVSNFPGPNFSDPKKKEECACVPVTKNTSIANVANCDLCSFFNDIHHSFIILPTLGVMYTYTEKRLLILEVRIVLLSPLH